MYNHTRHSAQCVFLVNVILVCMYVFSHIYYTHDMCVGRTIFEASLSQQSGLAEAILTWSGKNYSKNIFVLCEL